MLVQCGLCGGENERKPSQEMLACSYCGAALALEAPHGPEQLILVHKRDDGAAENVLRSFLIEKERKRPTATTTDFSFIPYAMVEDGGGKGSVMPACKEGALAGGTPYPPAGHYRFLDESCANGEKIIPVEKTEKDSVRIVYLPVYTIRYETLGWKGKAAILGESWQVIAGELPPERPRALNLGLFVTAAGLFVAYLVLGKLASNMLARLALIMAASGAGYFFFGLHEKVSKHE
jgi:hypothetical protein